MSMVILEKRANELQLELESTIESWSESFSEDCREDAIKACVEIMKETEPELAAFVGSKAKIYKCRKDTRYAFEWWVRKKDEWYWGRTKKLVETECKKAKKMAIAAITIAILGAVICLICMFR